MSAACVWCRESLPAFRPPPACPRCGKDLVERSGARLRPLDLDFEAIVAKADASTLLWSKRSVVFALGAGLVGVVPNPLSAIAFVLLFLGQFFWARFLIAAPYARHFGTTRKLVARWLTRLVLVLGVMPLHGAALAIPFAGFILSAGIFAGTCWAFRAYFRFHLLREHRREGVLVVEKVFLVLLVLVFVLCLVFFAAVLGLVLSFLPEGAVGR